MKAQTEINTRLFTLIHALFQVGNAHLVKNVCQYLASCCAVISLMHLSYLCELCSTCVSCVKACPPYTVVLEPCLSSHSVLLQRCKLMLCRHCWHLDSYSCGQ